MISNSWIKRHPFHSFLMFLSKLTSRLFSLFWYIWLWKILKIGLERNIIWSQKIPISCFNEHIYYQNSPDNAMSSIFWEISIRLISMHQAAVGANGKEMRAVDSYVKIPQIEDLEALWKNTSNVIFNNVRYSPSF
jgi:hypothetical protein